MTRQVHNLAGQTQSRSPTTKALLKIASISRFSRAWRTVEDSVTTISHPYTLDGTTKTHLSFKVVFDALSGDSAVNTNVDASSHLDTADIFQNRQSRRIGTGEKKRIASLYITTKGEQPPKLFQGMKWWDDGFFHGI